MNVLSQTKPGLVSIRGLHKSFALNGEKMAVLRDLHLEIAAGESLAIVGPSGCGKTTLLRILAGLEQPDQGSVAINSTNGPEAGQKRAVIFQEPRLLPWLTVLGNVAFGLEAAGIAKAEAETRAKRYIRLVGLQDFETAYPRQLSGGMAQRVGIARALTVEPEILLLDEPLGALDAMTKLTMQEEIARIWSQERLTMALVTHDLEEAIYLADRILILAKGQSAREITIDLPRPRDRSTPAFVALRKTLMAEFGLH